MSQRVATIDLGSNSCVFLVVEDCDGQLQRVTSDVAFTRLGQGLDGTGRLAADAVQRSVAAIAGFVDQAKSMGVERLSCVGTAALREASNRDALMEAVRALGCPIRAVTGAEEATLSYRAACGADAPPRAVMVDVGGASTEFAWGDQGVMGDAVSVPIGSVRLRERFDWTDRCGMHDLYGVQQTIRDAFDVLPNLEGQPLVAVAGTATTAAQCALDLKAYDPDRLDGVILSLDVLNDLLTTVVGLSAAERQQRYGVPAGRADVLPLGLAILIETMRRHSVPHLTVRDRGVAWGEAVRLLVV